jgi:type I restriction enzyme R subunit
VFWQTQGSGKSFAMVFFSQKILRKVPGNWTFVIVTDRVELDDQIAKTFAACGAVSDAMACHAESGAELRELLAGNNRYVFTLIHKFQPEKPRSETPSPFPSPTADHVPYLPTLDTENVLWHSVRGWKTVWWRAARFFRARL